MTLNHEIIEKLQKIMALANCPGATQGEMEAAIARAKEIAMRHGIELAALPAREDSKSKLALDIQNNDSLRTSTRYEHPYHQWVIKTLESVFGIRVILSRGRLGSHPYLHKIWLIGEATDVAMAVALFPWLERLFPKIYGEALKTGRLAKNFAAANGCYYGLYQGIVSNNKRQEDALPEADKSSWAMVVRNKDEQISEAVAKAFPKLQRKQSRKGYNGSAIEYGSARGRQINLSQVDATKSRSSLPRE